MIELETVELVLQLADFSATCCHLGIVATRLFHDLVDDQLGVALNIKPSDTQLDGNAQAIDERLIFGHIVGEGEMDVNHVPHAYPKGRNEDQPRASAFLHQRSIEVHCLVLFVDDCWQHLDLSSLYNEISQHLGLDDRLGGI